LGTTYRGGSNVVDAVIRTLRRKLGEDGTIIASVRGVGYQYRPSR
jgi:DNA-binding response OmpR family regulator